MEREKDQKKANRKMTACSAAFRICSFVLTLLIVIIFVQDNVYIDMSVGEWRNKVLLVLGCAQAAGLIADMIIIHTRKKKTVVQWLGLIIFNILLSAAAVVVCVLWCPVEDEIGIIIGGIGAPELVFNCASVYLYSQFASVMDNFCPPKIRILNR